MNDYFEKEITFVKSQYTNIMRRFVDETTKDSKVTAGTLMTLPQLKAEKLKSVASMSKTVANRNFFNLVFSATTDSLARMESIGRDDKKLFTHLKNLYLLLLSFLTDGIIVPVFKTSTTLLLKLAASKPNETFLPQIEFLSIIAAVLYCKEKLKTYFDEQFYKELKSVPNFIAICKEVRLQSFHSINRVMTESLHAWTLCISVHVEKLFHLIQSKFDYSPKFEAIQNLIAKSGSNMMTNITNLVGKNFNLKETTANIQPTSACNTICKAMIVICNAVRQEETELHGFDLKELFWKPLGQQFVGAIISNIRRWKITMDGGKVLLRDLDEYHTVSLFIVCSFKFHCFIILF
jgi:hypothetical protein